MPQPTTPCPSCQHPLDNHCARGCGWMACLNRDCPVRFVDTRNGHTTEKR